jgi:formate hydrogenlyase subunit 3/multisubunit Na+/H+ antiporter MnhD subunit
LAFASKAGLFPFHSWLPRAHPQAPSHISALMSGVMLKVAVYGLLRMLLDILPPLPWTWGGVLIVLGLLSAIFAVLRAAIDQDIKRILAFSSIENMGIIFIMLGLMIAGRALNSPLLAHAALVAALVHICAHALFKSGLFLGAGVLAHAAHSRDLDALGGLAKRMPLFSGAMLILSLAAAALPPFGAFVSEWFLLQSILTTLATAVVPLKILFVLVLAGIGLIGGVALFALVRFFGLAFLAEPRSPAAAQAKTPALSLSAPITILAVLTILFGVGVPIILPWLGAPDFSFGLSVKLGAGNLPLGLLATVLLGIFLGVVILRKIISNVRRERMYHTWDCGQPINATMEYTGMAFAAPFRFFFRWPLRRYKTVTSQAVLESNRWIRTYKLGFIQKRNYILRCYDWIGEAILFFSKLLSRFQSGIIQFYIALILITLIATILISL